MKLKYKNFEIEGDIKEVADFVKLVENKVVDNVVELKDEVIKKRKARYFGRNNKNWTQDEIQELRDLLIQGKSDKFIARQLHRSESAIKSKKQGLDKKKTPIRRKSKVWTINEIDTLISEYNMGNSLKRIAKLINKNEKQVYKKLWEIKNNYKNRYSQLSKKLLR